ncbi:hypothetical protein ACFLSQ_03315 [Bacteroidota bacterium]
MTEKRDNRLRKLPDYTYLGCPLTKNRSAWCFRICVPVSNGTGQCGRIAPHVLRGNIQQGIIDYKKIKKMTNK